LICFNIPVTQTVRCKRDTSKKPTHVFVPLVKDKFLFTLLDRELTLFSCALLSSVLEILLELLYLFLVICCFELSGLVWLAWRTTRWVC